MEELATEVNGLKLDTATPEIQITQEEVGHDHNVELPGDLLESTMSTITSLSSEYTQEDQGEQLNNFSLLPNYIWYGKEKEIAKLKAVVNEKDLEIRMLKTKLWETREIVQGFASSMSERISSLVRDNPNLESKSKELEEMRSELKDLTVKLERLVEVKKERHDVAEDTTVSDTPIPIMLEMLHLEKQQRLSKWLLETSSTPVYSGSDSGFDTHTDEGSCEPPTEYFEQQFLSDLAMKTEVLEEEIAGLTVVTVL